MTELVETEYSTILTYGCSAHHLNLLETEVTPKIILSYIVDMNKYFRNNHLPLGLLKEKGRVPSNTNSTCSEIHKKNLETHSLKIFTNVWKLQIRLKILTQILVKF